MSIMATAGFAGIILAFLSHKVRELLLMALSRVMFVFVRKTHLHRSLGDAFVAHMTKNGFKNKRFAGELYGEDTAFIRSENEVKHILYRDFHGNIQLFYGKGWPILVSGSPLVYSDKVRRNYDYVVYSFRWSVDLVKFLDDATENKNAKTDDEDMSINKFCVKRASGNRFFKEKVAETASGRGEAALVPESELANPFSAYVPVKWEKENIGQIITHNTMSLMSLNPEIEDLRDEIKFWFNSREWYEERGILHRRGYLLWGSAGTGKSMFSRAIAEELNVPLIIFDLASMNNTEFIEAWNQILPGRIVLFEDFDVIFDKRKNLVGSDLTFDIILNCLSGADQKQGILTIITTNYPEKLDYALGGPTEEELKNGRMVEKIPSRPGRIDRSCKFVSLDHNGRMKLAMRIVKDETMANRLIDEGSTDSAAQFQERCFRAAINVLFTSRQKIKEMKEVAEVQTIPKTKQL